MFAVVNTHVVRCYRQRNSCWNSVFVFFGTCSISTSVTAVGKFRRVHILAQLLAWIWKGLFNIRSRSRQNGHHFADNIFNSLFCIKTGIARSKCHWNLFLNFQLTLINQHRCRCPDSKVHGANMGPNWVLSAPDGPHVGPMNLAIRVMAWHWTLSEPMMCHMCHSAWTGASIH